MSSVLLLENPQLWVEKNYINSQWLDSDVHLPVNCPATGVYLGKVPQLPVAQVEQAIGAAFGAWKSYRELTAKVRADMLFRLRKAITENAADLASIIHHEQGKPLREAQLEVQSAANIIEWFAEEVKRIYGDTMPIHFADKRLQTIKQPIGVVAAITPWNFPLSMIARKCAPALAAGCPVIIKPAPQTPFSALAFAKLTEQVGFPAGVVNVINGDAQAIGERLCADKRVRKLSFTGSTEVGRILLAQSASTIKKVSLELGGNAPFIVFDDADIELAVTGAMQSKFRNAGQTCVCANRFYVQNSVADVFVSKLWSRLKALKLGGVDADIGPLIDAGAMQHAHELVADALAKGAQLRCGGVAQDDFHFQPTLLTDVDASMRVFQEEIFAPIVALTTFEAEDEVLNLANDCDMGLAGYFYSRDISRIYRVAEQLEVGMIGINAGSISTELAPFGGIKQSGIGREGSKYGIEEYLEIKYLCIGLAR